jgi:uncharacterized protein YkwD
MFPERGRALNSKSVGSIFLAMALFFLGALPASAAIPLERKVLREMNAARHNPKNLIPPLLRRLPRFVGKEYHSPGARSIIVTEEGAAAVNDALAFLKRQRPLPPLSWSDSLAASAAELVEAQEHSGKTGHGQGKRAMEKRIGRHLKWEGSIGEDISYGPDDGREVVLQLIIDDGVPSRGHRANIFSAGFRLAGVACGPHPVFGTVCVIDFAGGASN